MTTIKSYTDISQSKKLAEILPLESADMYWQSTSLRYYIEAIDDGDFNENRDIRAWSLAALYSVLPTFTLDSSDDNYFRMHCCKIFTEWHDNPIDCCVEMILKIKEKYL